MDSKALVEGWGIPATKDVLVPPGADPVAAARALRYPFAVKIASADIAHKSEAGGVMLGIRNAAELAAAVEQVTSNALAHAPQARIEGALVCEMVTDGVEMLLGVSEDPVFGPTVALGLGGVAAEALRDVSYRVAPFDEAEARAMIAELKGARLLGPFRGRPASDVEALARAVARVSQAAWDMRGRLAELDINPLFVRPQGQGVVAGDALAVLHANP
jgi:hypothetical protein